MTLFSGFDPDFFRVGVFFLLLIISAYTDLKENKIPDILTVFAAVTGGILALISEGFSGFLMALIAYLIGFLPFRFLSASGSFGSGDGKLMGAIGALTGPFFLIRVFWFTALSGCILAIVYLIFKKELIPGIKRSFLLLVNIGNKKKRDLIITEGEKITIPYGVAIAAGAYIAFFSSLN